LALRPEVAAQRLQVDTRRIALGVAENQVLPKLDLVAQQRVAASIRISTPVGISSGAMTWSAIWWA